MLACLCVLKIGSKLRADCTGVTLGVPSVSQHSEQIKLVPKNLTATRGNLHPAKLVVDVEAHALTMEAERRIDPEDGQAARSAVGSTHCRTSVQKVIKVASRNVYLIQPRCINVNKMWRHNLTTNTWQECDFLREIVCWSKDHPSTWSTQKHHCSPSSEYLELVMQCGYVMFKSSRSSPGSKSSMWRTRQARTFDELVQHYKSAWGTQVWRFPNCA